jgi:hypothetical protein
MSDKLYAYTGKGKGEKEYKPMLFQEIYTFFKDAPKKALKLFWGYLKNKQYREAINLLKQFLKLDISEDVIRDFLKEENEDGQLHVSSKKKFPNKGFLPRELPYGANMKKKKNKKYWGYSKPAEHISPTGFDMDKQNVPDLMSPVAINFYLDELIICASKQQLSNEDILEELYKILADLATFNEGVENKNNWSIKTEERIIKLIKNLENKNIKSSNEYELIASASTFEKIKKLISEYWFGATITLTFDELNNFWNVANAKGDKPEYKVIEKNGRYKFVLIKNIKEK